MHRETNIYSYSLKFQEPPIAGEINQKACCNILIIKLAKHKHRISKISNKLSDQTHKIHKISIHTNSYNKLRGINFKEFKTFDTTIHKTKIKTQHSPFFFFSRETNRVRERGPVNKQTELGYVCFLRNVKGSSQRTRASVLWRRFGSSS